MIEELPDYIVECLDEFISHYGTLEELWNIRTIFTIIPTVKP